MSDRELVERRTAEAFADGALADPRAAYRAYLRTLRERDAEAFERAVALYDDLVQHIAGGADAREQWLEYGTALAALVEGRLVRIDRNGLAAPHQNALDADDDPPPLVLHLPDRTSMPALPVALPARPSPAQQATLALLIEGRQELEGSSRV